MDVFDGCMVAEELAYGCTGIMTAMEASGLGVSGFRAPLSLLTRFIQPYSRHHRDVLKCLFVYTYLTVTRQKDKRASSLSNSVLFLDMTVYISITNICTCLLFTNNA